MIVASSCIFIFIFFLNHTHSAFYGAGGRGEAQLEYFMADESRGFLSLFGGVRRG